MTDYQKINERRDLANRIVADSRDLQDRVAAVNANVDNTIMFAVALSDIKKMREHLRQLESLLSPANPSGV